MMDVTVQECDHCRDRFCVRHISWTGNHWDCDKCLRRVHGLKKGQSVPEEATA
jgi:hypothetical protein